MAHTASPRSPIPSVTTTALPTLAALTLAGALAQGCIQEAHAQSAPVDAGVQRPPTPPTQPAPPVTTPRPPARGGVHRVAPGGLTSDDRSTAR